MRQKNARDLYVPRNSLKISIDVLLEYLQVLSIDFNAESMYAHGPAFRASRQRMIRTAKSFVVKYLVRVYVKRRHTGALLFCAS